MELEGTCCLCLQGVWFIGSYPNWTMDNVHVGSTANLHDSIQLPVYNVTYVTQAANADGTVTSSFAAGSPAHLSWVLPGAMLPMGAALVAAICNRGLLLQGDVLWRVLRRLWLSLSSALLIYALRAPMAGNKLLMVLTVRQRAAPVTILTPALMRAGLRLDALWQQKRSASLQPIHRNL